MSERYPPILKLTPGRDERRLKLIWKGHEELHGYMVSGGRLGSDLIRWGLLYRLPSVDGLDAYGGLRPTKLGAKYFIHDEEFHLILIRKGKGAELRERTLYDLRIEAEAASVSFGLEMDLAKQRGYRYEAPDDAFLAIQAKVEKRYVKRGFLPLNAFIARHDLTRDTLVVAGVLRYLDRKDPEKISDIVVGEKAKDLLLMSTRWQFTMVKPGMEEKLLALCHVELRLWASSGR